MFLPFFFTQARAPNSRVCFRVIWVQRVPSGPGPEVPVIRWGSVFFGSTYGNLGALVWLGIKIEKEIRVRPRGGRVLYESRASLFVFLIRSTPFIARFTILLQCIYLPLLFPVVPTFFRSPELQTFSVLLDFCAERSFSVRSL